jgi:pimeloyl-ACP methyl ester carboxylesterase
VLTLVIHGTADPMFPLAHGRALAEGIPGARLLTLEGTGHGGDRADWEPIAQAILTPRPILAREDGRAPADIR